MTDACDCASISGRKGARQAGLDLIQGTLDAKTSNWDLINYAHRLRHIKAHLGTFTAL